MLARLNVTRLALSLVFAATLFVARSPVVAGIGISLSPADVPAGTNITIDGSGFGRKQRGTVTFDGTKILEFRTTPNGSFSVSWAVPAETTAGGHLVEASTVRASASATLLVQSPGTPVGYLRGVNLAGGEFGETHVPGVYGIDYIYPTQEEFNYYKSNGLTLIRVPIRWERLQPIPGASLDATEVSRLSTVIGYAEARGMTVILDLHNYGRRYVIGVEHVLGDGTLTSADLADFWSRMATAFAGRNVWYGLMNEPHDLPTGFSGIDKYTWDMGTQGWVPEGSTALSHDTTTKRSGSGSLAMTATLGAGWASLGANNGDGSLADRSGDGDSLSVWVYLPPGSPGTGWSAKLIVQNETWDWISGNNVTLTGGQWTQVTYTPPAGLLAASRAWYVQVGAVGANSTVTVNVDDFQQGATVTGSARWKSAAQDAINAIRSTGATEPIAAAGYAWSGAQSWGTDNNDFLLTDPENNLYYEAHAYFDTDASGTYDQSYDAERAYATIGVDRAKPFVAWLQSTGSRGFFGEYGVPGDDPRWLTVLDNFLAYLDSQGIGGTYWAGGPWWGDYPLSVEPVNGVDRPQMQVLVRHLSR